MPAFARPGDASRRLSLGAPARCCENARTVSSRDGRESGMKAIVKASFARCSRRSRSRVAWSAPTTRVPASTRRRLADRLSEGRGSREHEVVGAVRRSRAQRTHRHRAKENRDVRIAAARVDQFLGALQSTRSQLFPTGLRGGRVAHAREPPGLPADSRARRSVLHALPGRAQRLVADSTCSAACAGRRRRRRRRCTRANRRSAASC